MSGLISRSVVKCLVIASYLLATTVSGLFHDHGHSCSEGCCHHEAAETALANVAQAESEKPAAPTETHCCHHHHHCCKHAHVCSSQPAAPAKNAQRLPGTSDVGSNAAPHGPCFVCQFLAHHHAVATVDNPSIVLLPPPVEIDGTCLSVRAAMRLSHPARGPPVLS